MNIIINKKVLEYYLKIAKKMIDNKTSHDQFKCINLIASDVLEIRCYNAEDLVINELNIKIDCEIIEKGECIVNYKEFTNNIKNCSEFIEITLVDNILNLKSNNFKSKIYIENEYELNYSIKDNDFKLVAEVDIKKIKESIKFTSVALSKDKTKPVIMNYLFDIKDNYIKLVAIDGYRMSISKTNCKNNYNSSFILDGKIVGAILGINNIGNLEIYENDKYIKFKIQDMELFIYKFEGEFIKYKNLIKNDYSIGIKINDAKKLYNILKPFREVCKDRKNNPVVLNIKNNIINIQDINNCMSYDFEVKFDPRYNLEIAFNIEYLLEGLKNIKGEITLNFDGSIEPMLITNENYKYLLLPVKIRK